MRLMNKTLSLLVVWMTAIYPYPFNLEPQALASESYQSELEKRQPPAYSAKNMQESHDAKVAMLRKQNEVIARMPQVPDGPIELARPIVVAGSPKNEEGAFTPTLPHKTIIKFGDHDNNPSTPDVMYEESDFGPPEGGDKPIGPPTEVIERPEPEPFPWPKGVDPTDKVPSGDPTIAPAPKIVDPYHLPKPEPTEPIGPPGKAKVLTAEDTKPIGPPGKAKVLTAEDTKPIGPPGKAKVLTAEDTKPIGPPGKAKPDEGDASTPKPLRGTIIIIKFGDHDNDPSTPDVIYEELAPAGPAVGDEKPIGRDKFVGPPERMKPPYEGEKPKGATVTATYELVPLPQGEGIDDRTTEAVGHDADPALKDASVDSMTPKAHRDDKDEEDWINKGKRKPAL